MINFIKFIEFSKIINVDLLQLLSIISFLGGKKDYCVKINLGAEGRMNHIVIDENKCKACYLCIDECPKHLICVSKTKTNVLGNSVAEFSDPNGECLGCAMCAIRCPDLAITEVYRG